MPEAKSIVFQHCPDLYRYQRRKTRVVMVGDVAVGGENPIRLQSMTTTPTMDTEATVAQTIRMVEAGCEIVRITAPTAEDARNLKNIKAGLLAKGVTVPLVADIHFRPDAALEAAEHVEKVRINPGNYSDAKIFKTKEYTDEEYALELTRIEEKFTPLVLKMKRLGRALRIGTNHGSLSDRIMNRFGDTPEGMVESALEFVRICQKHDFHDIILSMKSSNPKVMIATYRLLAARMQELGMDYPFHLGVTEAGGGEDGRIKSAIGIGSLLEDGIGDTIRVSLTEDPEYEVPVARSLALRYPPELQEEPGVSTDAPYTESLFAYKRRESSNVTIGPIKLGGSNPPRFISSFAEEFRTPESLEKFLDACQKQPPHQMPEILEWPVLHAQDIVDLSTLKKNLKNISNRIGILASFPLHRQELWPAAQDAELIAPEGSADAQTWASFLAQAPQKPLLLRRRSLKELLEAVRICEEAGRTDLILSLEGASTSRLVKSVRALASALRGQNKSYPIHLRAPGQKNSEDQRIASSILLGSLLCDGIGDSVQAGNGVDPLRDLELMVNILQGTGTRISKTEFVSCPSCGRTLFDLQSTTERIQSKTGHLKGVKIAIMGCIVNGPGEMADADFGYVGGAPNRINLYVGKNCVEKNVPTEIADERLIHLIKTHDKWVDPPQMGGSQPL